MKILLDENLNHKLRYHLAPHETFTVHYMGWSGLKNGKLLSAAEEAGFEVLLTGDQTLSAEQNIPEKKIAVVVLTAIEWPVGKGVPGSHCGRNKRVPRRGCQCGRV